MNFSSLNLREWVLGLVSLPVVWAQLAQPARAELPKGFVHLKDVDSSIVQDMRYAGIHNFTGRPVTGYLAGECILTREAAQALTNIQGELKTFGMSLKVYECYRPQHASNAFVEWAKDINDTLTKKEFYPDVDKRDLFKLNYVAEKSGHSRGSTVDLTLVPLAFATDKKKEAVYDAKRQQECYLPADKRYKDSSLDFGTGYDCFDERSHTINPTIHDAQKRNRLMLKALMEKNGFKNLAEEWWHFSLKSEPYPDTYYDFPVE